MLLSRLIENTKIVSDVLSFQGAVINQTLSEVGGETLKRGKVDREEKEKIKGLPAIKTSFSSLF